MQSIEFNNHVVARLNEYISATRSIAEDYSNRTDMFNMVMQDAQYAENALNQFKQDWNWIVLRNALLRQDTLPREECFFFLVERDLATAQAVGLTYELINS